MWGGGFFARPDPLATLTLHVLPPFTRLTRLELNAPQVIDPYLQHLGSLTALLSLSIRSHADYRWDVVSKSSRLLSPGVTPAAVSGVTGLQQLTSLELNISSVDDTMCPFFTSLTALRSLHLPWLHHLDLCVLTALMQLHVFRRSRDGGHRRV